MLKLLKWLFIAFVLFIVFVIVVIRVDNSSKTPEQLRVESTCRKLLEIERSVNPQLTDWYQWLKNCESKLIKELPEHLR